MCGNGQPSVRDETPHAVALERSRGATRPFHSKCEDSGKIKYLLQLDDEIAQRIKLLSKPYPKRPTSKENVAPGVHPGEGV